MKKHCNKWTFFILLTMMISFLLTACSAGGNKETAPGNQQPPTENAEELTGTQEDKQTEQKINAPDKSAEEDETSGQNKEFTKEELLKELNDIPMMDFTLNDLDGKSHTLSGYKGKIIVLNFWASWCPPCREEMPELEKFHQEVNKEGSDIVFLTINQTTGRETEAKARKFIEDQKHTLPVLLDKKGDVGDLYRVSALPTTFVIDKQGILRIYHPGGVNRKILGEYIRYMRIIQDEA